MPDIFDNLSSWETAAPPEKPKTKKPTPKIKTKKITPKKKTETLPAVTTKLDTDKDDSEQWDDLTEYDEDGVPIDPAVIVSKRTKIAEMAIKQEKAKQEKMATAVMRGELLKRELVTDYISPLLDRVFGDMRRLGDTFLSDIGKDIVEAGDLTPEIRGKWRDKVLEQQDTAKKDYMKELKEIDKIQAEKK